MERRRRNNGRTMTTFHSQQSDCGRRVRKNENASTFQISRHKLHHQFAQSCSRSAKNPMQQFSSHGAIAALLRIIAFIAGQALPLVRTRFLRLANSSPKIARSPARRSRDGRETSGKTIRRNVSRHVRATSRQWPGSGNGNAAECPSRRLARQLALRRTCARAMSAPETCETTRLKSQP